MTKKYQNDPVDIKMVIALQYTNTTKLIENNVSYERRWKRIKNVNRYYQTINLIAYVQQGILYDLGMHV